MIWATGFRLDHSWIDAPVFDAGRPRRARAGRHGIPRAVLHRAALAAHPGVGPARFREGRRRVHCEADRPRRTAPRPADDFYGDEGAHERHRRLPHRRSGAPRGPVLGGIELSDGDEFDLRIAPVAKRIGDATVRMLGYNGSIPGPTLKVKEGSEIVVNVENQGDMEATVHWHGLRLDNRYDGTHQTQQPMAVGESFTARVAFPTPASTGTTRTSARTTGRRWASTATSSSSPPTRLLAAGPPRVALTLDDILLEDGKVAPSAAPRRPMPRWVASATCCWSAARPRSRSAHSAARWCAST